MFDVKTEVENIVAGLKDYVSYTSKPKCIIGISGGKDSSVVAALAVKAFGKENVVGVMMPNGTQADIEDSKRLINHLGIKSYLVNIGPIVDALEGQISNATETEPNYVAKTNDPAGIRLQVLFGISRRESGLVLNTCNRSEDILGYSTFFGDSGGGYGPICKYTVSEVIEIGDYLGLPFDLVHKTPADGMCGSSDEENISRMLNIDNFTYARLDKLIRHGKSDFTEKEEATIIKHYLQNKFKMEIIRMPSGKTNLFDAFETLYKV